MKRREENTDSRARTQVHKRGKVGVQLCPIRARPHVPAGGLVVDEGAGGSRKGSGEEVLRAMGLDLVKLY